MSERAFRLDFLVASVAVVVSLVTALTMMYQTHVISQQYAATIWPYLSINANYGGGRDITLSIANDGLGPAMIRSAQLLVDGKPASNWNAYVAAIAATARWKKASVDVASVDASTTIRPGAGLELLHVTDPNGALYKAISAHQLELRFCYCSLNQNCWELDDQPFGSTTFVPEQVNRCYGNSTIGTDFGTLFK